MKNMWLSVFTLSLISISILTFPNESYACSCSSSPDYLLATIESKHVFIGTVTKIDNSEGPQKVHFDVESVVKGDLGDVYVLENRNIINTGEFTHHSSCDVGYEIGTTYNVFVYANSQMNNGMCTTKPVSAFGILDPFQYNLFQTIILVLVSVATLIVIIFVMKIKKK